MNHQQQQQQQQQQPVNIPPNLKDALRKIKDQATERLCLKNLGA